MKNLLVFALFCGSCSAASPWRTLHRVSVAVVAAAAAADGATSYGNQEGNTLLRGPGGNLGPRGLAIKTGFVAGSQVAGWLFARKHAKTVALANFGVAAGYGAIAARNGGSR